MAGPVNRDFDEEVLGRMAEGESLRSVCASLRARGCPTESRFRQRAIADDPPGFGTQYARARDLQCEALADSIIGIADDASEDEAQTARLRIDVRKWIASKILPKKYGDLQKHEVSGPDGAPVRYAWIDETPAPK